MQLPRGKNLVILITAVIALLVPVLLLEISVLRQTNGNIVYPLDNAFLDISVAKNLAFYKVWGVSKYAFQSASSSLLYPLLLVPFFFIAGEHLVIPIIVNSLAAIFFLYALQRALIRQNTTTGRQLAILLLAIFLTPLPLLVVSGMGYTVQLLCCFLFMNALASAIDGAAAGAKAGAATKPAAATEDTAASGRSDLGRPSPLPWPIYVYGVLAVAARYEDLVLILLACTLLAVLNRGKQALKLAAIALSPVLLFGIISLAKDSYFLPNSLLLGPYPTFVLVIAALALIAGCLLIRQYRQLAKAQTPVSIYRLSFALLAVLAVPFIARNVAELRHFAADSVRIYEQQYPMAAFVHRYYSRGTIGVNDIAAVAYFSDGRKLDYTGLASGDVTKSKKEHSWGAVLADSLSRKDGIRAAIVSDPWFSPAQLPKWNKIASWKMPDSEDGQASTGKTLTFYVINKYDTTWLRRNLHDYEQLLPAGVAVSYY